MASTSDKTMHDGEEVVHRPNISEIKNKQIRQEMYRKMKLEKKKVNK